MEAKMSNYKYDAFTTISKINNLIQSSKLALGTCESFLNEKNKKVKKNIVESINSDAEFKKELHEKLKHIKVVSSLLEHKLIKGRI